jgi:hypothetical protein
MRRKHMEWIGNVGMHKNCNLENLKESYQLANRMWSRKGDVSAWVERIHVVRDKISCGSETKAAMKDAALFDQ